MKCSTKLIEGKVSCGKPSNGTKEKVTCYQESIEVCEAEMSTAKLMIVGKVREHEKEKCIIAKDLHKMRKY